MTTPRFTLIGDTLVPGTIQCLCVNGPCGSGKVAGRRACVKCHGSGDGPRGGRRGCKACHGFGTEPDFENSVTCGQCDGTGEHAATLYDSLPPEIATEIADRVTWHVARTGRPATWNESYLGLGCLYSVTDYGRHAEMSDDDLIAEVRDNLVNRHTQAIKVADRDGKLATEIVVDCNRSGYSVRAYWGEARVMANASDYRATGMAVYAEGGNGTMAAALLDNASTVPLGK